MRVLKPDWIRHGDDGSSDSEPVYSIDLDRSGHRLATAALDNSIRIWSMTPLRAMEKRGVITRVENAVSTSPQLLCAMRKHQGSVNCVRWSPSGNMLASASDDHSVILWTMDNNAGTMSGESWRCSKILRQHTGDVMGVAWSPDGQFLASCSIDNTICLWNMETMTLEATLRGHNGPVKGVVWDPVRRYLASQGDDKKVIIWNVGTWKQRSSVTRPFDALGTMSTMFLRPAWTADGSYVVCPRAQSNGFPIAAGIDREGFAENETSNFVGHELPVSCARANPMLFWRRRSCDNSAHRPRAAEDVTSFLALGGEDGALSVWDAASPRALMALQHVCDHGILDLAWSSDGMELLACSQDGSVVYVQFEEDELGERVSRADQERIWRDTYGGSASGSTAIVAENVAQLRLEKARGSDTVPAAPPNAREGGSAAAVRGGGAAGPQPVQPPPRAPLAQVESRKDGKRRIAPCLVSSPNGGAIMATQFRPAANGFASATAGSTGALGSAGHGFSSADSFHSRGPEVLPVMQVQDVTHVMSPGRPDPAAAAAGGKRRRMQAPSDATGAGAVGGGADGMTSSADGARTVRLAGMAPPLSGKLSAEVMHAVPRTAPCVVSVHNEAASNLHRISLVDRGAVKWNHFLADRVVAVAANDTYTVAAGEFGCVHVLSASGHRLLPPLKVPGLVALLRVADDYVVVVTTCCAVHCWNLRRHCTVYDGVTLAAVVGDPRNGHILDVTVDPKKTLMVTVAARKGKMGFAAPARVYAYSSDLACWLEIGDADSAVFRLSDFHSSTSVGVDATASPTAVLARAQQPLHGGARFGSRFRTALALHRVEPGTQAAASRAHVELQMARARVLASDDEYLAWLRAYVRLLAQTNDEDALRHVCDALLYSTEAEGTVWPQLTHHDGSSASHNVDVVKTLLGAVAEGSRSLQRVVAEYHEILTTLGATAPTAAS
eukprot:m.1274942 g.1274942  ORF g.1274942 m.1274942 type:complete len:950 (+) comp24760_c1_seq2:169-3018(+)